MTHAPGSVGEASGGHAVTDLVEISEPATWPLAVRRYAEAWAERLAGTTLYPGDLEMPLEEEASFVDLLQSHRLAAYHCTRLLHSETDRVRREGLLKLTEELVVEKLDSARSEGHLSTAEHAQLIARHVFAHKLSAGRTDQVCVIVGRNGLDEDGGLDLLLTHWGGEATYWVNTEGPLGARLRSLGQPTVVAVGTDLSRDSRAKTFFAPSLHKIFVGSLLGLAESYGEAHIPGSIGPDEVWGVWCPGDAEFDRHPQLPRS